MCEHELKLLSNPIVEGHANWFSNNVFFIPPIFQCVKCFKVFKTDMEETCLVEIPVVELSQEGLKGYEGMYKNFYKIKKGE